MARARVTVGVQRVERAALAVDHDVSPEALEHGHGFQPRLLDGQVQRRAAALRALKSKVSAAPAHQTNLPSCFCFADATFGHWRGCGTPHVRGRIFL